MSNYFKKPILLDNVFKNKMLNKFANIFTHNTQNDVLKEDNKHFFKECVSICLFLLLISLILYYRYKIINNNKKEELLEKMNNYNLSFQIKNLN